MKRRVSKPVTVFFLVLLSPLALFAQDGPATAKPPTAEQFAGNYKGTAKGPAGDVALTMEIKSDKGKISGRLITPQGEQPFTSGEVVNGKLTIKLGAGSGASQLALQLRDDKAVGEFKVGESARPVEFKRVPPANEAAAAEVKKPATEPAAADTLSGDWEAAADANGQAVPFTLTLKVDGEKVTGTSTSQLGDSTISNGSWKDGKLSVILDSGSSQTALVGTLVDGKLAGDFDFNGQLQGKWIAVRKKP